MPVSQNGYSANDRSVIASYTVPGTNLKIALRKGDVSVVLLEYLRRYNLEVEPLSHNPQDLWGYAERTIRGSATVLSNHASGTAADHRAMAHPLGIPNTYTPAQKAALLNLVRWFEGVLRWGGSYSGRVDEMHIEIDKGPAEVARIANKVRNRGASPAPTTTPEDDLTPDEHAALMNIAGQIGLAWDSWEGGTGEKLTLVDYNRRNNVEVRQAHVNLNSLHAKIDALSQRVDSIQPGTSNVTASDVVDELLRRLKGA